MVETHGTAEGELCGFGMGIFGMISQGFPHQASLVEELVAVEDSLTVPWGAAKAKGDVEPLLALLAQGGLRG